jgi:hypothetical protein
MDGGVDFWVYIQATEGAVAPLDGPIDDVTGC